MRSIIASFTEKIATNLFLIVVMLASIVNATGAENCSEILDSDERLACYDKLADASENDSEINKDTEKDPFSGWIVNESKDPFTGKITYQAALIAKTENMEEVLLIVYCDKERLTIGAQVPGFIGDGAKVRYKFGNGEIVTERWLGGGKLIALPRYYNDFKRGLRTPVDILFEVENYDGTTDLVNFTNAKFGRDNLEKGFGDCK